MKRLAPARPLTRVPIPRGTDGAAAEALAREMAGAMVDGLPLEGAYWRWHDALRAAGGHGRVLSNVWPLRSVTITHREDPILWMRVVVLGFAIGFAIRLFM